MLIVDTQVHVWKNRPPGNYPKHHSQRSSFTKDDLLVEMDAAGVQRAVIVPPSGLPKDHCYEAVREHPQRFAIMDSVALDEAGGRKELENLRGTDGFLGLWIAFHKPEARASLLDGRADWIWREAEQARIPVAVWAAGLLGAIGKIAERHPALRLIVNHLGVDSTVQLRDGAAFAHMDELLQLSTLPNVAVKASGIAGYASDSYPFRGVQHYLEKAFRGFGPARIFWGTDFTRMPCTYRECVTHYTEELPFLSEADKKSIMGEAFCRWVGWAF